MRVEIHLPKIGEGEGYSEMTITRVIVAPGDTIQRDDIYMEIADSKVDIELPSPEQGAVVEVVAREGETKNVGDLLLVDTADPPEIVKRSEESANVRTAMQHFAAPAQRDGARIASTPITDRLDCRCRRAPSASMDSTSAATRADDGLLSGELQALEGLTPVARRPNCHAVESLYGELW
ncbi:MAG: lipoyl domain-containing protein [Thermoanaerobaculia bacterium]